MNAGQVVSVIFAVAVLVMALRSAYLFGRAAAFAEASRRWGDVHAEYTKAIAFAEEAKARLS